MGNTGTLHEALLLPLLFLLYVSKLFEIVDSHLPCTHCYAPDNTKFFFTMESYIADVSQ